ncbi:MAG: M1 family metallopeptidase [Deltaproteobacteria bacterium]|nr:M1 family metallopeptidase [Deltaproteobacteria bacterium]
MRVALVAIAVAGCGTKPATVAAPPPPAPPNVVEPAPAPALSAPPAGLRLPAHVRPTGYRLELTIVPSEPAFQGVAEIELVVDKASSAIWLHGADLAVSSVTATTGHGTIKVGAHLVPATKETTEAKLIGIAFDRPLEGAASVRLAYTGKLSSLESSGLYRQEERGAWYAFTQFEATDARRAFPCFDEPSFKVPFDVALRVKTDHVAVSNAPVATEAPGADGMKLVTFARTPPLPSYLVAFAVGPFDVIDGGKGGKRGVPLRIIAPKGRGAEAAYATKTTPELLAALEDYFGMPYPYDKLDQVAVPRKGGAMENAGLITYGLPLLLWPQAEDTIGKRRRFASIATHELAHQWFGDYVTLAWWDDIWLNESFASWMEDVIGKRWQPSWGADVDIVQGRGGAMRGDLLATARRIRQPIESVHDIRAAFDGITYAKGSAVIAMFESYIGPETFQKAVAGYLRKHPHGVATTADFLAAIHDATGNDVAPAMSTFLDQTGVPLVDAELRCTAGAAPVLALSQQRYAVAGAPAQAAQTWTVPVCVKWGTGATTAGRACTLLATPAAELELGTAPGCPAWVLANDGEVGYYRTRYHGAVLDKLVEAAPKALTLPERVGLLGDMTALVDGGHLSLDKVLAGIPALAKERDRQLVNLAVSYVGYLDDDIVPPALRPNRARMVRKLFGDRARALGWIARKGEPDDHRLLRPQLLSLLAHTGEDAATIATAKDLAKKWLADKKAVDPDLVGLALGIAARHGDRALWDRLYAAAKGEKERKERGQLLGAMAGFRDPAIVKAALPLVLGDDFDPRESLALLWGALGHDETSELAYAFLKDNLDKLLARLPRDSGASFIGAGSSFCDAAHRADVEAFFKDRAPTWLGGPRGLAQTLERMDLCIVRTAARKAPAAAFLATW